MNIKCKCGNRITRVYGQRFNAMGMPGGIMEAKEYGYRVIIQCPECHREATGKIKDDIISAHESALEMFEEAPIFGHGFGL
jgi:hypothetical protein